MCSFSFIVKTKWFFCRLIFYAINLFSHSNGIEWVHSSYRRPFEIFVYIFRKLILWYCITYQQHDYINNIDLLFNMFTELSFIFSFIHVTWSQSFITRKKYTQLVHGRLQHVKNIYLSDMWYISLTTVITLCQIKASSTIVTK